MHPNLKFRKAERQQNLDFATQRGFGTLAINGENGPLISHIPFFIDSKNDMLEGHLVRSNPIIRELATPQPAVIAITGPHSYISPDWYKIDNQVPTWNYVAVHLRGNIEKLPADKLPTFLERLSNRFEQELLPKPVWTMDKVSEVHLERLLKIIIPFQMKISSIDGTWKLGQNKSDEARISAAQEMSQHSIGSEIAELATLMKNPPA